MYRYATAGSTAEEAAEVARIVKSGKYPSFPKGYRTVTGETFTKGPDGKIIKTGAGKVSGGVHGGELLDDLPNFDTRTPADIDAMAEVRKDIAKEQIKHGFDDPKKEVLKANTHQAVDDLAKSHGVEPPPKGKIKGKTQTVRVRLTALRRVVKPLITGPAAVVGAALPLVAKAAGPAGVGLVGGMNADEELENVIADPNYKFSAGNVARNTGADLLTDLGAAPYDLGTLIPRGINWAGEQLGAGRDWLPGMGLVRKGDELRGGLGRSMRHGLKYGFDDSGLASGQPSVEALHREQLANPEPVDWVAAEDAERIQGTALDPRLRLRPLTDYTPRQIRELTPQPAPEFTRDPRNRQPYHGFKAPLMDRLSQQPTPAMPGLQPAAPSLGVRAPNKPVYGPPVPGLPGLLPPEV